MDILFRSPQTWPEQGKYLLLRAADPSREDALARAVLEHGANGLVGAGMDAEVVYAPTVPVFDDMLALWLLMGRRPDNLGPEQARALCDYARVCRQGYSPGEAAIDRSPRTIFEELRKPHADLTDDAAAHAFIDRSFELFDHLAARLTAGADLLGADLFEGTMAFGEEIELLRGDREVYLEDRARAEAYQGVLGDGAVVRPVDVLVLEEPVSNRFADWARQDVGSPSGAGFAVLLVRWPDGMWVLSADPRKRITVGALAEKLQSAEERKSGRALVEPWYAGARHRGTLVAAPRVGTALTRDEIVEVLRDALQLRKETRAASPRPSALSWPVLTGFSGLAAVVLAIIGWQILQPGVAPSVLAERGDPIEDEEVIEQVRDVARERIHYAILAGVNRYSDMPTLRCANADARELMQVLTEHYGYERDNILYLIDDPEDGERVDDDPTTVGLRKAIEKVGQWTIDKPDSTFLFFYAGHGERIKKASPIGFLIPSGSDSLELPEDTPLDVRFYDMQHLPGDIEKYIYSQHSLIMTDCCFSGFTMQSRGEEDIDPRLYDLWKEEARVILTAGTEGETAKEDARELGHALFTQALLYGLELGDDGHPGADENGDGILTDSELGGYVSRWVPRQIRRHGNTSPQHPQYYRDDGAADRVGQFLFVPSTRDPAENEE